ncbi:NAD(P)H-dependent oxidoreductase [Cohnella cholangitidis]|uniref:NAD(P)H-dependent oxidoreductase n=1 Tax=Cohnella cholangitidis TaxID=2598458 RepID=A0A7G5BXX1_9BACL|nr:NAD(P)H-dependent oxidoreductase [Cohnella cholangitidis]QMV41805.1 NAD(P)H-dependent oxidoreductase [Cohnella cholangitidis]
MAKTKEEILNAYLFRHACKEFDPERKIADEDFAFILETARLSPSSYGFEPWKFVVLQNPDIREKLRAHTWGAQRTLPTASHFILILARKKSELLEDSDYIQSIMKNVQQLPPDAAANKSRVFRKFLESDFKLLEREGAVEDWAGKQTYIALGNMMTAAALIGIDSCPIEGFERDPVDRILREEGINDGERFHLVSMVAFGYRVREPRPKTRRELGEIVEWK